MVTYTHIVVDYRPQKEDPNRVYIIAGREKLPYLGEVTTRLADLITSKVLWNSTISTRGQSMHVLTSRVFLFKYTNRQI